MPSGGALKIWCDCFRTPRIETDPLPTLGAVPPTLGRLCPRPGTVPPTPGALPPTLGRDLPSSGPTCPRLGWTAPGRGSSRPSVGGSRPSVGESRYSARQSSEPLRQSPRLGERAGAFQGHRAGERLEGRRRLGAPGEGLGGSGGRLGQRDEVPGGARDRPRPAPAICQGHKGPPPAGRNLSSLGCQPQVGGPPRSTSPAGPACLCQFETAAGGVGPLGLTGWSSLSA